MRSVVDDKANVCADPLLSQAELRLERAYFPLGFPVRVITNSELVLAAAEQSWGGCHRLFDVEPVRLEIGVAEGDHSSKPPVFRARGHLMSIVSDSANSVVCDMRAAFAFGWVSPETASNRSFFRYHFLEVAALTLIEQLYLAPFHSALIARRGTGVLLSGDTGAGKSTLALACALNGWDYLSDDATYLLRGRSDLFAVGNSRVIRLRADAANLFEYLGQRAPVLRPNGKCGFEVFTSDLRGVTTAESATIRHLVRLHRSPSATPSLEADEQDPSAEFLQRAVQYGDDRVMREQSETYQRLVQARWWTLTYRDFEDALTLLNSLVKE